MTLPNATLVPDASNPTAYKGVAASLKFKLKIKNGGAAIPQAASTKKLYTLDFYFAKKDAVNGLLPTADRSAAFTILTSPTALNFGLTNTQESGEMEFKTSATLPSADCALFTYICSCVKVGADATGVYTESPSNNNCGCKSAQNLVSCAAGE